VILEGENPIIIISLLTSISSCPQDKEMKTISKAFRVKLITMVIQEGMNSINSVSINSFQVA
jgi:hypothetical protein